MSLFAAAGKPYSEACERNQGPILSVLREYFADRRAVLEIGSGTGQHAACFAAALPQLQWQPSDRSENLEGIQSWRHQAQVPNLLAPVELDVDYPRPSLLAQRFDALFTANTMHIMHWPQVERFFSLLNQVAETGAVLVIYGPFNRNGKFTSESNAAFDSSLKDYDPGMGIRDRAAVGALAAAAGFALLVDRALPANNDCLVWRRGMPA